MGTRFLSMRFYYATIHPLADLKTDILQRLKLSPRECNLCDSLLGCWTGDSIRWHNRKHRGRAFRQILGKTWGCLMCPHSICSFPPDKLLLTTAIGLKLCLNGCKKLVRFQVSKERSAGQQLRYFVITILSFIKVPPISS